MVVKYAYLNLGTRLEECKLAAEHLKQKGVSTTQLLMQGLQNP